MGKFSDYFRDKIKQVGGEGSGILSFENINSDTTVKTSKAYLCDVSDDGFKVTLPKNPKDDDIIGVVNYKGSFKDNNLKIDGNGNKINGKDTYTCKLTDTSYTLQYSEDNEEWVCLISSSFALSSLFAEFMCEIPELSNQSADEINEGDYIEIDIDNYDENAEYLVDNELVTKFVYKSDKTFKVYFGSVDEDTDTTFKVRAIKTGYISSSWSKEISITIKDKPEEEDDAIINDAFADNEDSSSDCDVTNDKVIFTEDGGGYKEVITEQGDDEEDWSSYQTIVKIDLEKMNIIDDDTDKDTLAVKNEKIKDVAKCYIVNDDYPDGVEIDIRDVDEDKGTLNVLDILNDDSCKITWRLNGDATDLSGDYDGTEENDLSYSDDSPWDDTKSGFFDGSGNDSGGYISTDFKIGDQEAYSWSAWFKTENDDEDICVVGSCNSNNDSEYRRLGIRFVDGGKFYITQSDNSNEDQVVTDNQNVADNKWHHAVVTANKKTHKLYIDNNKIGEWDLDVAAGTASDYSYSVGRNGEHSGKYFDGLIAQVRFFNKEVTDDEVDKLYNEFEKKYKADISSNDLDNAPTSAYFIEENVTIKTALTKDDDPTDDDFNDEKLDTWKIDTDNDYKENSYKKISDYSGNKFQRKITGDKNANITYLKSNMWKDQ